MISVCFEGFTVLPNVLHYIEKNCPWSGLGEMDLQKTKNGNRMLTHDVRVVQ